MYDVYLYIYMYIYININIKVYIYIYKYEFEHISFSIFKWKRTRWYIYLDRFICSCKGLFVFYYDIIDMICTWTYIYIHT
jgi:hypothetical protein